MKLRQVFFYCIVILGILSTFLFCAKPATAAPPQNFQTQLLVGSGLSNTTGFGIAPDGRIFILERTGAVKIYKNGALLPIPFVTFSTTISGDRGLIGIAFDPDFLTNHYVYFYMTSSDEYNRVIRLDATTDIAQGDQIIIYQTSMISELLHVGGTIQFGPDKKLYIAIGDNGNSANAQDLGNPHGKILRINKDGSTPGDNPFVNIEGVDPEIYAYGLRNPFRFQFDEVSGRMYEGDVGAADWEEINTITPGGNYGWPAAEGNCTDCPYSNPIFTYNHANQSSSITGGPVYHKSLFPSEYQNNLFFGDYARGFIRRLQLDDSGNVLGDYDFDMNAGSVVDLKVGNDGGLYYITYFPSRLYKITYSTGNHSPIPNADVDTMKGISPLTTHFTSSGTYDPDNDPLSYFWNFGDGTSSSEANPTKIYTKNGNYIVTLTVRDNNNLSNQSIPLVIQVGLPPAVIIGSPKEGATYRAGDTIAYTAFASDGVGFDLGDESISTQVLLHHDTHAHPFYGPITGRSHEFTIPITGEPSANTWYEIIITATDANGLTNTKSVSIFPIKSTFHFTTVPAGISLKIDGQPFATPKNIQGVSGYQREIEAYSQDTNGHSYQFSHWSNNGPARQTITTTDQDTNFIAYFTDIGSIDTPASNLQAAVQANNVTLSWNQSSGIYMNRDASDSDHIQVYTNADYTGTKVLDGGVGGGITSWTIPINNSGTYNSLQPGRTYYARVYSWNAPCNCANGTTTSFTTSGTATNGDKPPTNLSITGQTNQIVLNWSPSTGIYTNRDGSDHDHIQVYSNPNFTGTNVLDGGVGGGISSWSIPINTTGSYNSVQPGKTYYAHIYSFNAPCNCSNDTRGSFTVPQATGGTGEKPATNLQVAVQESSVILSWNQSSGIYMNRDASDSDHIQVYTNPDYTGTKVLDGGVGGGNTSWTIPINDSGSYNSVQRGKTYYARVYSWNASCNCSDGTTTSFTVTGTTNDHAASNLQALSSTSQVTLSWLQSSGIYMNRDASDSDHIQVYTNPDYTGTKVLDGGVGGGNTSWTIPITNSGVYNSLNSGTTYYARVYSWNAPCNCSTGTTISFITP